MKKGLLVLTLAVTLLAASCANTPVKDQVKVIDGIELRFEDFPDSSIPAFVAKVRIRSSMGNLMLMLMDFSSWPDWAYGCERIEVLQTVGFTEAYLYQVTRVPVIRDRDSILHAISTTFDGETLINFESAPDFCLKSERAACESTKNASLVRVREMSGSFSLKQISNEEIEVTWRQHQDPGGLVPEFLVRSNLSDIPLKSLTRLKALAESP
ncbi:MAG: hypothetical protein ACJAVI_003665 [Candidatus Azotimanducaceae bacterium]